MAKWAGKVGYVKNVEKERGDYEDTVTERTYYGDSIENHLRLQSSSDSTNGNFTMSMRISIVSDSFAIDNMAWIRYIEYKGTLWSVTDASPEYPRLILSIGGIYNGKTT